MAFDYNGTINKANALNEYAELIKSYKNEIITLRSSLNDYWKNAMVPEVPELFYDADVNLDNVYWELKRLSEDIVTAANHVRDEEWRQQQEVKRRQEAAALAARQTVNVVQPTPVQTTAPKQQAQVTTTKTSSSKSTQNKDDDTIWDDIEESLNNVGKGISNYFKKIF